MKENLLLMKDSLEHESIKFIKTLLFAVLWLFHHNAKVENSSILQSSQISEKHSQLQYYLIFLAKNLI